MQPHSPPAHCSALQPCSPATLQPHSPAAAQPTHKSKGSSPHHDQCRKPQPMPRLDLVPGPGPVTVEPWSCANLVAETMSVSLHQPWEAGSGSGCAGQTTGRALVFCGDGKLARSSSHPTPSPALPPQSTAFFTTILQNLTWDYGYESGHTSLHFL